MDKMTEGKIVGRQYGYLTVIGYNADSRMCDCRCECGSICKIKYEELKHEVIKSCGCKRASHADRNMRNRICRSCGVAFKGGPRAFYCPECREERRKESSRKSKARTRAGKNIVLGGKMVCEMCGREIIRKSARQRFCEDCARINIKEVDRKQSMEYYDKNKDKINYKRRGGAFK